MTWQIRKTYARATPAAIGLLSASHASYFRLAPPAVSTPLLAIPDVQAVARSRSEFEAWRQSENVLDADAISPRDVEVESSHDVPKRDELMAAKWFARTAPTPVVIYGRESAGGTPEYEWAWVFPAEGDERILMLGWKPQRVERIERGWFRSKKVMRIESRSVVFEITANEKVEHDGRSANVFAEAARYLGVLAQGGEFEPHTRMFRWAAYHVGPKAMSDSP